MTRPRSRREHLAELVGILQGEGPRPPELSAALSGDSFDRCLQAHLAGLPILERLTVQRAWHLARAGLLAARRGELSSARQYLDESLDSSRGLLSCQPAQAFCQSVHSAADAYLLYRRGNHDGARAALRLANDADLTLLRHGVGVAHLHRTQLVHNRIRVEVRCGSLALADQLAGRLIDHLEGSCADLPLPGPWEPELLDACPVELVAAMIYQVSSERQRLITPQLLASP